ncbi:hypothetical protein FRC12_000891 [Ceratobasidium sp. 428]|nr:hypothetical protein FRC12_000891 [Ceratobasidium sp. 428]
MSATNHIQQGILEYLQRKAAEPVEAAVAYFSTVPPPLAHLCRSVHLPQISSLLWALWISPTLNSLRFRLTDESLIDGIDNDETNRTVEEVYHHILNSESAQHAAQLTSGDMDAPEDQGFEVLNSAPLPAQAATTAQSDRATRRFLRLLGRGKLA